MSLSQIFARGPLTHNVYGLSHPVLDAMGFPRAACRWRPALHSGKPRAVPGEFVDTLQPPAFCYDASKCLQARHPLHTLAQAFEIKHPPERRAGRLSFRVVAEASTLTCLHTALGERVSLNLASISGTY